MHSKMSILYRTSKMSGRKHYLSSIDFAEDQEGNFKINTLDWSERRDEAVCLHILDADNVFRVLRTSTMYRPDRFDYFMRPEKEAEYIIKRRHAVSGEVLYLEYPAYGHTNASWTGDIQKAIRFTDEKVAHDRQQFFEIKARGTWFIFNVIEVENENEKMYEVRRFENGELTGRVRRYNRIHEHTLENEIIRIGGVRFDTTSSTAIEMNYKVAIEVNEYCNKNWGSSSCGFGVFEYNSPLSIGTTNSLKRKKEKLKKLKERIGCYYMNNDNEATFNENIKQYTELLKEIGDAK